MGKRHLCFTHTLTLVLLTFVVLESDSGVMAHLDSLYVENDSFYVAEQVITTSVVTLIT